MKKFLIYLVMLLASTTSIEEVFAQGIKKSISIKVVDASTQRAIEGATVKLQGLLSSQTKTTNAEGNAYFEWILLTDEMEMQIEVTESFPSSHYPYKSSFTLLQKQDSYSIGVALRSSNIRFNVKVIDAASGESIENSKVTVLLSDAKDNTGFTDASGNITLDIQVLSKFTSLNVKAEKDGYSGTEYNVSLDEKVSSYTITLSLIRNKNTKVLQVVVKDEKNMPVPEANVSADGNTFPAIYNETTDANGLAKLIIKAGGEYTVTVRHGNFETVVGSIIINIYGEQDSYTMRFDLKRKRGKLRDLTVIVIEENSTKKIINAFVDIGTAAAKTNNNGEANLDQVLALGETGKIVVAAHGYEETTVTYIGGGENYRYSAPVKDLVYVRLKKEKVKDVNLIIQVLDKVTDRPIGKANVSIKNKNGSFLLSGKSTNVKGEAETIVNKSEFNNAPFRVMAKANGYTEQWSDITADFLLADNDPLFFTIFLEQKKADQQTGEKKYGPFNIGVTQWVSTGIQLKKGQYFRVSYDTSSKVSYVNESNGQLVYMYPDGHGYWGWFVLAAKIGEEILHVGRGGGGAPKQDGALQLGAPRVARFIEGDGKGATGAWKIYVYVRE